ncbi:HAD-IA family hydrolase [Roseitranquillus sediminis]|uniref:HAD-IA family hydrolase n=1 Tax=Roseitranquillus sediminis TaxID=2809051 RepID=UPI001D0CA2F6|nr:HAD-IA family hydrolase [Roseitranquillus sediminis]MBM9595338.1 HAD-IA family hydrolase [Roseitranquillus sediminis]
MRTVIFDLDGTLVDTSGDLIAAANFCFRELGAGDMLDPAHDAATAFRGGRAMLRLGFERSGREWTEADVDSFVPILLKSYEAEILVHSRLYPGVVAAVEALKRAGYATGVCTNKPQNLAELLLARLDVRRLFDGLVGADTLPVRKPDPDALRETVRRCGGDINRTVLIGDTDTDRNTAKAAGVPAILVTFGPQGDGVAALGPEALLAHYDDLERLVGGLIG